MSSKQHHPHGKHGDTPDTGAAPPVLPRLVVTVHEPGTVTATLDGAQVPPPAAGGEWTRATVGGLLDAVTKERTIAVRIEVREIDGTVFTDLIHARRRPAPTSPHDRRRHSRGRPDASPALIEVTGDGFVPGEDVAVAIILAHTDATSAGRARALLDQQQLGGVSPGGKAGIVLCGRVSGTTAFRRLP